MKPMKKLVVGNEEYEIVDAVARSNFVTPEMFGAVGDGVTNDSNAIAECFSHPFVVCPKGKTYLVKKAIVASSNVILGNNATIKFEGIQIDKGFKFNSDGFIRCHDLIINANKCVSRCFTVDYNDNQNDLETVVFDGCKAYDTENYDKKYNSNGISISRSANVIEISNSIVHDVHRTSANEAVTSANGISVTRATGLVNIHDNYIENISTDGLIDTDAIATFSLNSNNASADDFANFNITNNFIKNSCGRFVKCQGHNFYVGSNVFLVDAIELMQNFVVIDFQNANGIAENNHIEMVNKTGGASAKLFAVSGRDTATKNNKTVIRNNVFKSNTTLAYGIIIAGDWVADTSVSIEGNNFEGIITRFVLVSKNSGSKGLKISVHDNYLYDCTQYVSISDALATDTGYRNNLSFSIVGNSLFGHYRDAIVNNAGGKISTAKIKIYDNSKLNPFINGLDWSMKDLSETICCLTGDGISDIPSAYTDYKSTVFIRSLWGNGTKSTVELNKANKPTVCVAI